MSRGIAAQNQNPGQWRTTTVETGMLYDQWQDANQVPVPYDVAVRVEIIDNTGRWRLPFRVIRTDAGYVHANKGTPVLQAAVVKLWRT